MSIVLTLLFVWGVGSEIRCTVSPAMVAATLDSQKPFDPASVAFVAADGNDVEAGKDVIVGVPMCAYSDRLRIEQVAVRVALRASAEAPALKRRRSDVGAWVMY